MLKYGMCFYTTLVVKNYSSTPPNTAYFFSYPIILSSLFTPVINNDRPPQWKFIVHGQPILMGAIYMDIRRTKMRKEEVSKCPDKQNLHNQIETFQIIGDVNCLCFKTLHVSARCQFLAFHGNYHLDCYCQLNCNCHLHYCYYSSQCSVIAIVSSIVVIF